MFTDDKITEIFCLADDFCKFFDSQVKKYTLPNQSCSENKRKYHREPTMSKAVSGRSHLSQRLEYCSRTLTGI